MMCVESQEQIAFNKTTATDQNATGPNLFDGSRFRYMFIDFHGEAVDPCRMIEEMQRTSSSTSICSTSSSTSGSSSSSSSASASKRKIFSSYWARKTATGKSSTGDNVNTHMSDSSLTPSWNSFETSGATPLSMDSITFDKTNSFDSNEGEGRKKVGMLNGFISDEREKDCGKENSYPSSVMSQRCTILERSKSLGCPRRSIFGSSFGSSHEVLEVSNEICTTSMANGEILVPSFRFSDGKVPRRKSMPSRINSVENYENAVNWDSPRSTTSMKHAKAPRRTSLPPSILKSKSDDGYCRVRSGVSVSFNPQVKVMEFQRGEVNYSCNGWSKMFTYN